MHLQHPRTSRRTAIQAGTVGLLGLGMEHLAALRAADVTQGAAEQPKARSVIYIFLSGGLAQHAGGLDPEIMEQIRQDYGLDLPLWQQMLKYFSSVVLLDLGYSFYYNQPVTTLILEKLPATLLLVISAQVLSLIHI